MRTQVCFLGDFRKKLLTVLLLAGLFLPATAQWTNIYTGLNTKDVDPVNDSTWFMSQYYVLKKTTDYGATWNTVVPYLLNNNIEEMFFLDENRYWLVGYDSPGSSMTGWVYYTSDGGLTFQTTLTPQSYGYLTGVWFTSAGTGYVTSYDGQILKSVDGGASFSLSTAINTSPLRRIKFYNANIGMAVGDNGAALLTTNAGASWTAMNIDAGCYFTDLELLSSQHFVVVGTTGMYVTTNGGQNWTQATQQHADRVDFPTATTGYAGGYGTFYRTTDGGQSWLGVNAFSASHTSAIFFMDANHGYACNEGGIWETTNGVSDCPTVYAGPDQHVCTDFADLVALPSANNMYTFSWTPAANLSTPTHAVTVAFSPTPNQTVAVDYVVTMSDPFTGCPPVSDTVRVTYDSLHFTPNYTSPTNLLYLCPGDSILIDPASGASNYQWFGPGGPFTTPTIIVDTVGTWSVNVTDCAGNVSVYGFLTQFGSGFVPNYAPVNIFYPCYGDTTVLTFNGGALSYTWSNGVPGPTNIISTADTFYCIVDHCVSVDTFEFRFEPLYCDSVWPGDASYDGIANMYDLLNLGVAFGSAGPPRTDQSIGWYAHDAVDWANSFANIGRNFKHADCDGDGVVDYPDTTAIVQNYGQVHTVNPLMGLGGPNDPPLYFSSIPPQIEEGSAVTIPVYLGSSALPMNDFYGGAFSINYDTNFVKPNSVHITFSPSWVGSLGTTAVAISKNLPMEQRIDLAIARTDHQPISGYGEIAQLHIIMQDDISAVTNEQLLLLGAMMTLSFDNEKFINAQEEEIIVSPLPVDISVLAGVEENEEDHFSLYPNPADEYITIQSPGTMLQKIEIIDLQGRTLLVQNTSSALAILNIAGLEPGVYMVRCGLQNGATGLRRLIVR